MHALDEQQQQVAIVAPTAYPEILTAASRKAALRGQPSGLAASKVNAMQFNPLMTLIEEHARNVPDELAKARLAQMTKAARNIYFAWSRADKAADPHYYPLQTPASPIPLPPTPTTPT